ncbi:MAG: sulfocyanin-like copper-binding protein [Nocardioidaceae bacterium]
MDTSTTRTVLLTIAPVAAALLLAGCATTTSAGDRTEMMGSGSGYTRSRITCSGPTSLPGTTVRVTLADRGMNQMMTGTAPMGGHMRLRTSERSVPAGQVSLLAVNRGWRTHELVVLPLDTGSTVGQLVPGADGRVNEADALGESSRSCGSDGGEGITSGATGWTTLTLSPGRYELVCNLKNHYATGMRALLVVT